MWSSFFQAPAMINSWSSRSYFKVSKSRDFFFSLSFIIYVHLACCTDNRLVQVLAINQRGDSSGTKTPLYCKFAVIRQAVISFIHLAVFVFSSLLTSNSELRLHLRIFPTFFLFFSFCLSLRINLFLPEVLPPEQSSCFSRGFRHTADRKTNINQTSLADLETVPPLGFT